MNAQPKRQRRTYDHRLRQLFKTTGDPALLKAFGIPRSTLHGWSKRHRSDVVSCDVLDRERDALVAEVLKLRQRIRRLASIIALLVTLLALFRIRLDETPLPDDVSKKTLIKVIGRCQNVLPLAYILRLLHLSPARYHVWKRNDTLCEAPDTVQCPRRHVNQLTREELGTMKAMTESPDHRHIPTSRLALYAQRLGKVYVSATTWTKQSRLHGWLRPRKRLYPTKPKIGHRTTRPNECWHVDLTIIKLLNGTKVYLHAVIDNFSRKILAWQLDTQFNVMNTVIVLQEAARQAVTLTQTPTLVVDGGIENLNENVDKLVNAGWLSRMVALRDVVFSNSMIEAFWRTLKHQWLYLHTLDSVQALERLIAFYVTAHNTEIPHSAFRGQTPDEMYFGTGTHVPANLKLAKQKAREARIATNRAISCAQCAPAS